MRTIKEFEGIYFADECGNIHTLNWRNTGKASILKPAKDKKGYLRVGLMLNGVLVTRKVHRLVAQTFIDNPENKPEVNHIDGNKQNNNVLNLEWATPKENTKHAIDNNMFSFTDSIKAKNITPKKGELNGCHKLTEKQVIEIRQKYKPRIYTRQMLANEFNVKESCIKDVVEMQSWKHI